MYSDQSVSGVGPVSARSSILVDLILPDPCLSQPLDDGHATIEVAVLHIKQRKFSLEIYWVKSTHYQGRKVEKICLLSTTDALRRDLDSLWFFTTEEEMNRVVRDLERFLLSETGS